MEMKKTIQDLRVGFDKEIETLKRIETKMKMKVQNQ